MMWRVLGFLVALLALASCGGGDSVEAGAEAMAAQIQAKQPADVKRRALFVPAGADPYLGAAKLMDFAEASYPNLFPGHKSDFPLAAGFVYRYYPETGVYIAVVNWRVYVLGGPVGPYVKDMGELTDYVKYPAPNQSPTAVLTSPLPGARFTAPGSVSLTVSAFDPDGTIAKVEFYSGSTKIGEDLSAPFQLTWNGVSAGTYQLTAKATDNLGATTTSSSVAVTVVDPTPNQMPTVSITSPVGGASLTQGSIALIEAIADDKDGSIAKVEFYYFNILIGSDMTRPYSISWTPTTTGSYDLYALAYDNTGAGTVSAPVKVTVVAPGPTPSPAGTITAAGLAKCPLASSSADPNAYLCMVGSLVGYQTFNQSKTCTLVVSPEGAVGVLTDGASYAVDVRGTKTYRNYSRYSGLNYMYITWGLATSSDPISVNLISHADSGKDFFVDGGWLEVKASRYSPATAVSCTVPVPSI